MNQKKILNNVKKKLGAIFSSRRRIAIFVGIVIVLIIGVWRLLASRQKAPQYQTSTVQKGTIVASVSASGNVLTTNIMNVTTQASGIVKAVYVKDGDQVYAGQKIAEITLDSDGALRNAQAWASLVSANNSLNNANNNYRATQASLANVYDQLQGHATDETFAQRDTRTKAEVANDNAYNATVTAQANLVAANLAYRVSSPIITAPISGTVGSIGLVPGMVLAAQTSATSGQTSSQRVAVVQNQSNPILTFSITEVDAPSVKVGQDVTVTFDSISDKTFTGKVMTIDRVGVTSNNVTSYTALIQLDTSDSEILPNMSATANIITQTKSDVLLVPSTAIQTANNQSYVRVLKNGQITDVNVETGISSDTDTETTSGLSEGDVVVTGTAATATTGTTRSIFGGGGFGGGALRVGGGR